MTFQRDANNATLAFRMTAALAANASLPPQSGDAFTDLYVRRRDDNPNYADHPLPFRYRIDTLNPPPQIGIEKRGTLAANEQFFNFADPNYADGDYIGSVFEGEHETPFLSVLPGGAVVRGAGLEFSGLYSVTVLASSPQEQSKYVGTARMTFSLAYEAPLEVAPADIVAAPFVTVYAIEGFSGPAHSVNVGDNIEVTFSARSGDGFTLASRAPNDFEFELSPLRATVNTTLTIALVCDNCLPPELTVTLDASFRPVFAPKQEPLRAVFDSDFTLGIRLPENFDQGYAVFISTVSPPEPNFQILGTLLSRPPGETPDAGDYTLRLEMLHPGFLGELTLLVTANIAQKIPSDQPGLTLLGRTTVTVAHGHEDSAFALTIANPDFEFGRAEHSGDLNSIGLTLAPSADNLTMFFVVTAALSPGEALPPPSGDAFASLYVQRRDGDPNFADVGLSLAYRIETLNEPPTVWINATTALSQGDEIFNFADASYEGGIYAGARFGKIGGSGALEVLPGGAVVVGAGLNQVGRHTVTAAAQSPSAERFAGTARFTLSLTYGAPADLYFGATPVDFPGNIAIVDAAGNPPAAGPREVTMTYDGLRRGLHIMRSAVVPLVRPD